MSNATNTLNKVKAVLGLEVKMEQLKMENGTVLEADKFENGESVFIVTEDEKVALPVGEYELEDNRVLKIEEEGVIASLAEEEEVTEEEVVEEEVTEEELEYVSKQEFAQAIDEIKAMIEKMQEGEPEEEMTEEVEASTETEEQEELKAELSKPAVEPLKHSPEKVADQREMVRFAQKRPKSILDKVFEKLNN
jgi:hypothetical protein